MTDSTQILVVTTTFPATGAGTKGEPEADAPSDPAAQTVRILVEEGLAACGQIFPGAIRSFFHWEGSVQDEAEVLVTLKTTEARWKQLQERLRELHPYEVPEIVACPVRASQEYGAWLHRHCGSPGGA